MTGKKMNSQVEKHEKKRKRILFLTVFLVLGFTLSYSYRTLGKKSEVTQIDALTFAEEEKYREELVNQKERNKELTDEIIMKQEEIRSFEQLLSSKEETHAHLVEEAENLRLLLGMIPATGPGIKVTLSDAEYNPRDQNPNDYIVHESHVLKVVNELRISGAQGIAINGERITANSYIVCTGPVITIDDKTFPAPFVIEAVGESDVLASALHLKGGVIDSLMRDNIVVTTEQLKEVHLSAVGESS